MNLREMNLIYQGVPDFMQLKNGKIIGLYMIFENSFVQFAIEIKYSDNEENKIGLFGFDMEKKVILNLSKEEYIRLLYKINKVSTSKQYLIIKESLERIHDIKNIVKCDNFFVVTDQNTVLPKYKSKSYIKFDEIDYEINTIESILYCTPSIASSYARFNINQMDKNQFTDINYLTNVSINIEYNNNIYNDFGNIKKISRIEDEVEVIIEPIQVTLLETLMVDEIYFNQITPQEMIKTMSNITNAFEVEKNNTPECNMKKYKYITTLKNFELKSDILQIGDVFFSNEIEDMDINSIKPSSKKYIYVFTYVTAETIAEAQKVALQKIESTVSVMQLIEKNSCFYKLYNQKNEINEWDIRSIFIDYYIGEKFYVFNIFETNQSIYGSNKEIILKNYGCLEPESDLMVYNDEINELILNSCDKKSNILNAIYWLNKGIEEINLDLNKCVLYLNIALEYCANEENGESFFVQHEEAREIFESIKGFVKENYNNEVATQIINILNGTLSSPSVRNRFEVMLKKLKINYTKEQFDTYKKIRDARNGIIHNGKKKVDIQKHDIIGFYMFLSKVIFYKLKED